MRYFPTAVVIDRQAIKSPASNLATWCFCNVKNLISKSSWWTSTDRLPSFILLPSSTIIFFSPWCHSLHWHHAYCMEQHYKCAENMIETPPEKIHWEAKQGSLADREFEISSFLLKLWEPELQLVWSSIPPLPSWHLQILVNCWSFFTNQRNS